MRGTLGGTCLNVGCIPSKALLASSHHYHDAKHNFEQHGIKIEGNITMDIDKMLDSKAKTVQGLTGGIEHLLKKHKVDYFKGKGSLAGPNSVNVQLNEGGEQVLNTKNVVLASGSEVTPLPPVPVDNEGGLIVDSTGALDISKVPESMAVIGGGVIGLEMGSVWSRLGSKVTGEFHVQCMMYFIVLYNQGYNTVPYTLCHFSILTLSASCPILISYSHSINSMCNHNHVNMKPNQTKPNQTKQTNNHNTVIEFMDRLCPAMDLELTKKFQTTLKKQGFKFSMKRKVTKSQIAADGTGVVLTTEASAGGKEKEDKYDIVLVATGRRPYTDGLGLEKLGIQMDPLGRIEVDDHFRTAVPSVYAIGDCIDGPMLAHKAEEEGIAAIETIAGFAGHVNYDAIPGVIYTYPEVAAVGKTEE